MEHGSIKGRLEVIVGPMFSGKTTELLRLVEIAEIAKKKAALIKPDTDNRYEPDKICSHKGWRRKAHIIPASDPHKILEVLRDKEADVVAIEEAQLFSKGITDVIRTLNKNGVSVIACGLALDFKGEPFGSMPQILAYADNIIQLFAVCKGCHRTPPNATRTQRLLDGKPAPRNSPVIHIGAKDDYEARCPDCHEVP